ncbi:MAG TPA: glutamine--fructose-6-phosphate transaminase (isomerizing) [Dehalococcoidia bacterium]|nr:glutamine--fructose-6-phosphate transaminase (isomerizing) [Dehalococcoidia bacterium]
MCGIVGYVGQREAAGIVLDGLAQLEYRGYDSAGIAVLADDGRLSVVKDAGRLAQLQAALKREGLPPGRTGIGHTRWATHGKPSQLNAHPHSDRTGDVVVIHNGIVENYRKLREDLAANGHTFVSETDTEVIPHLISELLEQGHDLESATRAAMRRIEGAAAVLAMRRQEPGVIVAARVANAGGVVIGHGEGEMFVASDLPAVLTHTDRVVFLDDGDMARVTADGASYSRISGEPLERRPVRLTAGSFVAGKGAYADYMAKEIAEQPEAVLNTLRGAVEFEPPSVHLPDLGLNAADIAGLRRVVLIGMGTSWNACGIGRAYMERLAGLPAEVDNASEYRYRQPVLDSSTLVVALSQSGESVDTLGAMHEAKRRGARLVAVCNTPGAQATRIGDGTVYMRCGPEVAVASTKTYVGSLVALYLLACHLGHRRGFLDDEALAAALDDLARMPQLVGEALKLDEKTAEVARRYADCEHFLFLGRGLQYPMAMEGALKLKEVSYIHAEGYAAAEMKHGPIALIDERMPVVAIAVRDEHYTKMLNNIEEVRARDGIVIAIATEGDEAVIEKARDVLYLPDAPPLLQPLVTAVPMQLLAYHMAKARGCDVDKPRNLAKVVTVE